MLLNQSLSVRSSVEFYNLYLPFLQNYKNCIIVAPDKGSINKVETIGNLLNIDLAYITKERDVNNSCNMIEITGNVEGRNCILIDDIIDSGETIYKAANFLKQHGALSVNAFITHAVLSKNYDIALLDRIFVTDTIETDDLSSKFHIIPILPILVKELKNII